MKLAGAPISWGVCEVPRWGLQLPVERVLDDMAALGLSATEAGPPGFLPDDPFARSALLGPRRLRLVGAFVTAVLHDPSRRAAELASVTEQARALAAAGGEVLVLAAATGRTGYTFGSETDEAGWAALFTSLDAVAAMATAQRLTLAVHPHWGTLIERPAHIERFLSGSHHGLCLDTGHIALGGADPLEVARTAGERVRHVHLKDVEPALAADVRAGRIEYAAAVRRGLFTALGDGAARIAEVLALLRSRGYGGWYVLEHDVMLDAPPPAPPPWIEKSVRFARSHAGA